MVCGGGVWGGEASHTSPPGRRHSHFPRSVLDVLADDAPEGQVVRSLDVPGKAQARTERVGGKEKEAIREGVARRATGQGFAGGGGGDTRGYGVGGAAG